MAMLPRSAISVQIVHFNDVYNIDETVQEPAGGAARFVYAIRSVVTAYPGPSLVIFSGDAFSPAPLTSITEGAELPPVLNACGIDIACIGNHEFDRGMDILKARIAETNFPWLVSNVTERSTALPVAGTTDLYVLERSGIRFGFIGLASDDWLLTLNRVNPEDLNYIDFVAAANRYSALLRDEHHCDYIIALTHMRTPDDERLAQEANDVDLILGGHDHILFKKRINGRYIVKSGTDFKNFSTIELIIDANGRLIAGEPVYHDITSDVPKDPAIADFVTEKLLLLDNSRWEILAHCTTELDGRFFSIRTRETGLGNFVADVLSSYMGARIGLINAGSFRSDAIELPGDVNQGIVDKILPYQDEAVLVDIPGDQLLAILENGVSQYPLLDGRFLQVSGMAFAFDPKRPPLKRIQPGSAKARDDNGCMRPIVGKRVYRCAMKTYIFDGKEGYPKGSIQQVHARSGTSIPNMVSHYFAADAGIIVDESLRTISPQLEDRIVCLCPDADLLKAYKDMAK